MNLELRMSLKMIDINELKLNLMDLIESESNNLEQHFKAYARDKMIESIFSTN